ncbi:hypothetical protein Ancab_007351 [Ancistrocladus abbreviatus]
MSNLGAIVSSFNTHLKEPLHNAVNALMMEEESRGGRIVACNHFEDQRCCYAAATLLAITDLDQQSCINSSEYVLEEPELDTLVLRDLLSSVKAITNANGMKVIASATEAVEKSAGTIVNTMDFLEHTALGKVQDYFPAPIFPIGLFHKINQLNASALNSLLKEDRSCLSWLDKQPSKSVLYVSFGSVVSMPNLSSLRWRWDWQPPTSHFSGCFDKKWFLKYKF